MDNDHTHGSADEYLSIAHFGLRPSGLAAGTVFTVNGTANTSNGFTLEESTLTVHYTSTHRLLPALRSSDVREHSPMKNMFRVSFCKTIIRHKIERRRRTTTGPLKDLLQCKPVLWYTS